MEVARVDARRSARTVSRSRARSALVEVAHAVEAGHRAEQLRLREVVATDRPFRAASARCRSRRRAFPTVARRPPASTRAPPPGARCSMAARIMFELPLVDDRAEIVVVARADLERRRSPPASAAELIVDRLEDDDAAAGGAALPGVAEGREHRPLHRARRDRRRRRRRTGSCRRARATRAPAARRRSAAISRPTAVEPVKLMTPTSALCDERRARLRAEALHDVEHAGGQARLVRRSARTARPSPACPRPPSARRRCRRSAPETPSRRRWRSACSPR